MIGKRFWCHDHVPASCRGYVNNVQANEPDTLNYEWTISGDSKNCHIYERYVDSAATLTHWGTFGEKYAERFMSAVDPTRFVVYGDTNNEVKAALAGFGAVFMSPFGGFAR
ncbi:antibiotic biosynthesis monooxygenase [Planctomycetota bacterium]